MFAWTVTIAHLQEVCELCVQAEIRTSFEGLYRSMSQREEFRWMMLRIKRMAEPWVSAIRSLAAKQNLGKRRRKKVGVLYMTLEKWGESNSQLDSLWTEYTHSSSF